MNTIECDTETCTDPSEYHIEHYEDGAGYYCADCALDVIAEGME
jgi:hypothetical protein